MTKRTSLIDDDEFFRFYFYRTQFAKYGLTDDDEIPDEIISKVSSMDHRDALIAALIEPLNAPDAPPVDDIVAQVRSKYQWFTGLRGALIHARQYDAAAQLHTVQLLIQDLLNGEKRAFEQHFFDRPNPPHRRPDPPAVHYLSCCIGCAYRQLRKEKVKTAVAIDAINAELKSRGLSTLTAKAIQAFAKEQEVRDMMAEAAPSGTGILDDFRLGKEQALKKLPQYWIQLGIDARRFQKKRN